MVSHNVLPRHIILLGAGMVPGEDGRLQLSQEGLERADRFLELHSVHKQQMMATLDWRVVCSGGFSLLNAGIEQPEDDNVREGILTADYLIRGGVDPRLIEVEKDSTSTLENYLKSIEQGFIVPEQYTPEDPLGNLSHPNHLKRARFLAGKAGIPKDAMELIATYERDNAAKEFAIRSIYRALLAGATTPEQLRSREQLPAKICATMRRNG